MSFSGKKSSKLSRLRISTQNGGYEDEFPGSFNKDVPNILENLEKWTQRGSNWAIDKVKALWLDVAKYQPFKGGCCYFEIPKQLKLKRALIPVKCNCKDERKGTV